MNNIRIKRWGVLISPILIIILGNFAARFFTNQLGKWAWTGYFPVYWGMLIFVVVFAGKKNNLKLWFRKSQGSNLWIFLSIVIGLISFPLLFIPNIHVMHSILLIIAWCSFALINSIFEEVYWRGLLLDKTANLPRIYGVIYSTVLFTAIHPLNLGVFSRIQAFNPGKPMDLVPFLLILGLLSIFWCLLYLKTKSLRLSVLSHILTDLGNLSVFLFMNMVQI